MKRKDRQILRFYQRVKETKIHDSKSDANKCLLKIDTPQRIGKEIGGKKKQSIEII